MTLLVTGKKAEPSVWQLAYTNSPGHLRKHSKRDNPDKNEQRGRFSEIENAHQ
jgi:hypothetical protein